MVPITVQVTSPTSVVVKFKPKGLATQYEVGVAPSGSESMIARSCDGRMEIINLTPDWSYDFATREVTQAGFGTWGKRTSVTMPRRI